MRYPHSSNKQGQSVPRGFDSSRRFIAWVVEVCQAIVWEQLRLSLYIYVQFTPMRVWRTSRGRALELPGRTVEVGRFIMVVSAQGAVAGRYHSSVVPAKGYAASQQEGVHGWQSVVGCEG